MDPQSDLIFSIDPGIVNVGVACFNSRTRDIVFADKLMLAPSLKAIANEAEIIPRVFKLFFDDKNSPYKKMIDASRVVLIECQMKRKMLLIQHIIATFCFRSNIEYEFVCPRSIKVHFGIGKKSRVHSNPVQGEKKNHAANKRMAFQKAVSLFPAYMATVKATKQDDIADALLQAVWFVERKKPTSRKRPILTLKRSKSTKKRKTYK